MISLEIKGKNTVLYHIRKEDGNTFELVDNNNNIQMIIRLNGNAFEIVDNKNVTESKDTLLIKLNELARSISEQDFSGIEDEEGEEENDPFNPEEISIETRKFTMETCIRRLEQKTLKLNPNFQRQEVWTEDKKSQLIESLMLKIPIPMFYVSSDEKSNLTVVDGLQRLSTIRDFVLGKKYLETKELKYKGNGFKLAHLEFWKEFEGKTLNDLPTYIYNRIIETEFTFTVINPGTPEEVRRNIFKRLNTGGMPLSSQEIRNALYIGKATDLLNDLAKEDIFIKATCNSIKSQRMEDKELILRFVSFIVRKYTSYTKTINVDTWPSDTMIIINATPDFETRELNKNIKAGTINLKHLHTTDVNIIKDKFILAMTRAHDFFGEHAFRKSYPGLRRTPINKSLFETWGVLLSDLQNSEYATLKRNKRKFMAAYIRIIENPEFVLAISRDSMKYTAVQYRFSTLKNLLNQYLL